MMEEEIRSILKDDGRPMTTLDISEGIKKTEEEVNQVIYKMSDVEKTEDTPPKWMLRGEFPTVSPSATSLEKSPTKIDFATGMPYDVALANSHSVSVLNESGTTLVTLTALPESSTSGVVTPNHQSPVQFAGKLVFVKEENDDQIIFTKVKPTTFISDEGKIMQGN